MTPTGYTTIPDWMLDLNLGLTQTVLFAVIYGFSQDADSCFNGSISYLARKINGCNKTAARALKEMVDKGLLIKEDQLVRGMHLYQYRVAPHFLADPMDKMSTDYGQNVPGVWTKCPGGMDKMSHNNIVYNNNTPIPLSNDKDNSRIIYSPVFDNLPGASPVSAEEQSPSGLPNAESLHTPLPPSPLNNDPAFEEWWKAYGRKGCKKKAKEQWSKLDAKELQLLTQHLPVYTSRTEFRFRKDFERYLRDKVFQNPVFDEQGKCLYDPYPEEPKEVQQPEQKKKKYQ